MINNKTDFIDIHKSNEYYEKRLENLKKDNEIIPENKKFTIDFLKDCELGKTIKNKAKKKINSSRLLKYTSVLKTLSRWFNKPFDKVTQEDMERVISNLEKNKYKTKTKKNYSEETKLDFKKAIKKFYKWLLGENVRYPEIVEWFDTSYVMSEIPALTREEVEKLADACKVRDKALIIVLFDSGARIGEFLNFRIGDLTWKEEGRYYMIRIKHSKTKPRTISISMSTIALNNWLEAHPDRNNPNAQLFPIVYDAVRMFIKRIGKQILKKDINAHLLRHSSATYYCHKLSQYQLCYRYGWSMASKQPARYIDREGIMEEETAEKVKEDDVFNLKKENRRLQETMALFKTQQEKLERAIQRREKLDSYLDKLFKNQKVLKMIER